MGETKKMLIAYDGSQSSKKALLKAKDYLMKNPHTEFEVISVWDVPIRQYEVSMYDDIIKVYKNSAQTIVEEAEGEMTKLNNKQQYSVLQGHPSTTIIDYAKDYDFDLIVIGSRGLGGIQKFFLGSVSYHVVQKAHCSVLVVK